MKITVGKYGADIVALTLVMNLGADQLNFNLLCDAFAPEENPRTMSVTFNYLLYV